MGGIYGPLQARSSKVALVDFATVRHGDIAIYWVNAYRSIGGWASRGLGAPRALAHTITESFGLFSEACT